VVAGVVGLVAGGGRVHNPSEEHVIVNFPSVGKVEFKTKAREIDYDVLLEQLFLKDFTRNGTTGWLRDKRHMYSLEGTDVVDALSRTLCEPIPNLPIDERIRKAQDCASKPVAEALRRLARERAVPFHYVGTPVRAGIQVSLPHRPGRGRVNTCRPGPFVGQRLQVIDPATSKVIEVEASGTYGCTLGDFPGIQLDPEDGAELFSGRPLAKLEDVIVVIL
jgi:hypothetical protein